MTSEPFAKDYEISLETLKRIKTFMERFTGIFNLLGFCSLHGIK